MYEMSVSQQQVLSPTKLRVGEYAKIRLWLPGDTAHVFIELAEIRWIKHPWISVEILVLSATDQQRIKRFTELQAQLSHSPYLDSKHILIRA